MTLIIESAFPPRLQGQAGDERAAACLTPLAGPL